MIGIVFIFNKETNEGEILGEDEKKYYFHIGEWLSYHHIKIGQEVDYEIEEDEARNIRVKKLPINEYIVHVKINFSLAE